MRFTIKNVTETAKARTSATVIALHMPSSPKNIGKINTDSIWNIRVLRKEIAADTPPLFKAVKNEEENIFKPASINAVSYTHLTLPTNSRV